MDTTVSPEERIFAAVLELPPEERGAFLARECGADAELRARVEALVAAHERAGGFMEGPLSDPGMTLDTLRKEVMPERVGRYRLREKLGEGGCGVVYLAEQHEPVHRRVALKVIKLGMDTREVIARFQAERQALALMDHPNIAHVLDAGATEQGRPYFVMELVHGEPITKYCDLHRLETKVRLGLFIQVCRAVQHAHQKGIIHRDLKPSNILVSLHDNVPVPKIIDFGIAKATQGRLTEHTLLTSTGQFIGTPAYMSPEQAEMGGLDIDTRTDIYALGALLYELLSGRPPFDPRALAQVSLDELRRQIREVDPPRPSQCVATLPREERLRLSWLRGGGEPDLPGFLRGDLDLIVMRSMDKNRGRRYETANGIAVDVERFLLYEPIAARPPSVLYTLRKFTRRHRALFGMAAALLVVLVTAAAVSTREAIRSARAEREQSSLRVQAEHAAARSEQVAKFLKDMLQAADAMVALGHDTRLLSGMMDVMTARLARDLRGQPEVEADLHELLGTVYLNLGDYRQAEERFSEALAVRQRRWGGEHPEVARSLNHLGVVLGRLGRPGEAESLLRRTAEMQERLQGPENANLAETLGNLGVVLAQRGQPAEAVATINRALAMQEKLLGRESADVARSLKLLGTVLEQGDRAAEAEACLRDALAINRKLLGERHPEVASTMQLLGVALVGLGRYTEALELYVQTVAIRQRLPESAGRSTQSLISALEQQGSLAELDRMLTRTVESMRLRHGRESLQVAYWLAPRVYVLLREGKYAEAEPAARECLAIRQRLQPDDWSTFHAQSMLGGTLAGQGKYPEAERWLLSGYEGLVRHRATLPRENAVRPAEAAQRLAEHYQAWGRPDQAAEWRRRAAGLLPPAGTEPGR